MAEDTDLGFWGEYEHGVDDKGRVIVPQDFREPLGSEFIVTRGPDHAIWMFPSQVWQQFQERLQDSVMDRSQFFLQRMMGGRTKVKLDPQARLAIPKHLREWAGITPSQSAVIIGQGQRVEVWSKSAWDAYNDNFTSDNMFSAAEAAGLSGLRK